MVAATTDDHLTYPSPVRRFRCGVCGHDLYFENSSCLTCGASVGYCRDARDLEVVGDRVRCVNATLNGCNWIVEREGEQCFSCSLTRTRPADGDPAGLAEYAKAEQAKRRLVHQLDGLGLPMVADADRHRPALVFDLLSSSQHPVVTGHDDGVVTIDMAEGDDAHREKVRTDMGEAYRTLLGHFRHEVGHYVEQVLVVDQQTVDATREVFGDASQDYGEALQRHYDQGPPEGWEREHVSAYATMHPFEDFAETFAHVLHIRDALETAAAYGVGPAQETGPVPFATVVGQEWLPLTFAVNQLNRSLGMAPFYPFVLAPAVIDKLVHVDGLIAAG